MRVEKPLLLGIGASLRNGRWGIGSQSLITAIENSSSKEKLYQFLAEQSDLHIENFLDAGRQENKSFDEIYRNLKKNKGDKGLSNSEVALAAALWAAYQEGVAIDHLSLAEHFLSTGKIVKADEFKEKLLKADGLIISGPVYFGDRGSLAHSFIDFIRQDKTLQQQLEGKIYGGLAVGAKRNGGQETTLIYQMWDMLQLNFLTVGNDSETTSQYGGTGHAGDVGSMHKDDYGLETSMGTGRRMSELIKRLAIKKELKDKPRILFLILQDQKSEALSKLQKLLSYFEADMEATVLDVASRTVYRCIACDICPTTIDVDSIYRCIIKANDDDMEAMHHTLLHHDAIVPVTLSRKESVDRLSNYQNFLERSRYLRRGDYVFSNQLVTSLTYEELDVHENYAMRIMTSMLRHHTVMFKPLIAYLQGDEWVNQSTIEEGFGLFLQQTKRMATARLSAIEGEGSITRYNPMGYLLSKEKDNEDEKESARDKRIAERHQHQLHEAQERLQ